MNETALFINIPPPKKKQDTSGGKNELHSTPSQDVHRTDSTSTQQAHKLQIPGTEYTANKICPSK